MKKIPVYKFYKHKYGDELLVDVISYEKMMPDIRRTLVFSETFYSITLVLDGDTSVAINGRLRKLERGLIICSIPGEVWSFEDNPQLDALNLVFEKEFLLSFFSDPHFLDRFTFLAVKLEFMMVQGYTSSACIGLYIVSTTLRWHSSASERGWVLISIRTHEGSRCASFRILGSSNST